LTKVLITGGAGQLASALQHHHLASTVQMQVCSRSQLDITQVDSIQQAIAHYQPDIIVNCAAYTAVDKAEQETEQALLINHIGAGHLASACNKNTIPLIHISTDYVFDGTKGSAYQEDDRVNPINQYGNSKWLGEQAVRELCEQHIILRVCSVFSEYGNNFFKTMLRLANEKTNLRVVSDQISCPTYAGDIAGAIFQLIAASKTWGTYHYGSHDACTWHAFASAIIAAAKEKNKVMVEKVDAITTAEYPLPAKRPAYSVLNCHKIAIDYGISQPDWAVSMRKLMS
jgi:dTDP-4-dehydrorhamnose reductase